MTMRWQRDNGNGFARGYEDPQSMNFVGSGAPGYGGYEQTDKLHSVADRLWKVRHGLPQKAAKVYRALQESLQRQGTQAAPSFEKDFQEHLALQFPEAWEISTQQIGGWNQWQVSIDGGKPIYCSVRMEVLSENPDILRDIKAKARVIKETLLEDNGKWKRIIESGASREKLLRFKQECASRTLTGATGQRSSSPNSRWVEAKTKCQTCGKALDDDQLSGEHMCVVFATFQCAECGHAWTSHQGRLRPDDGGLIRQMCSRCSGDGLGKDWRVDTKGPEDYNYGDEDGRRGRRRGMHQSELCGACREYGNCMGIFYDPFIVTTALGLFTGKTVKWFPHSEDLPELLIADLGPQFENLQVCLEPHVYFPQEKEDDGMDDQGGCGGRSKGKGRSSPMRGGDMGGQQRSPMGRGDMPRSQSPQFRDDYRGNQDQVKQRQRLQQQLQQQRQHFMEQQSLRRQHEHMQQQRVHQQGYGDQDIGYAYGDNMQQDMAGDRQGGGIKDRRLLNRFLGQEGGKGGKGDSGRRRESYSPTPQDQMGFNQNYGGPPGPRSPPPPPQRAARPKAPPPDVPMSTPEAYYGSDMGGYEDMGVDSGTDARPKARSFNKISSAPAAGGVTQTATPLLSALPRLRQQQLLQMALRQVHKANADESQKYMVAEHYLEKYKGDFDEAYSYLKDVLGEHQG